MTKLEKAEELVRNHPANKDLMELVAVGAPTRANKENIYKISPAHLQHYLRVLGEAQPDYFMNMHTGTVFKWSRTLGEMISQHWQFNLTTGKPASEKDAEEFIKLITPKV